MLGQPPSNAYTYESQGAKISQTDISTSHKIDILCLAILVL
jgi:hypothetical protein